MSTHLRNAIFASLLWFLGDVAVAFGQNLIFDSPGSPKGTGETFTATLSVAMPPSSPSLLAADLAISFDPAVLSLDPADVTNVAGVATTFVNVDDVAGMAYVVMSDPFGVAAVGMFPILAFEFVVREATFKDKEKPEYEEIDVDVVVDSVTSGGWADLAGLEVGDVILEINDKKIGAIADVEKIMKKARKEKLESVVFFVRRGSISQFVEMEASWQN